LTREFGKRILIKFSGEFLRGASSFHPDAVGRVVQVLLQLRTDGFEFGIVIGAGNLFRGKDSASLHLDRVVGDQIGMLGTIMNALVVRDALLKAGVRAHVMAPHICAPGVETINPLLAREYLQKGEPVLFAGGTGNNYFTTDSAATLRALEIGASLLVKSTKVNGVYSQDPVQNPQAERFSEISFSEVLERQLAVMDQTAIAMAMEYTLPVFVYKFCEPVSLLQALQSQESGTMIVP